MSKIQEVVVRPREGRGKGDTGRLRRSGLIPSVVYGLGVAPTALTVEPKQVSKVIHSELGINAVLNLRLEGTDETRHVMIKSVDVHPVTDRLTHVDFLRLDMDQEIHTSVEIELVGLSEGVKLGGVLSLVRHELEISCLPKNLIGAIQVDVTEMKLNDTLRVGDLPAFEGVTYKLGASRVVAVLSAPGAAEEVTEEEEFEEPAAAAE